MSRFWRVLLIAAAIVASYANSLEGPFILDDQSSVVQNPDIRDLGRLVRVLLPAPNSSVAGRPLASASFALNFAAGGLDVTGYHLVNIALHLACAWLLFGVVRRTLELPALQRRSGHAAPDVALAVALVWALHPLNTEVVDYLTQRTESLMTMFLLLTVYASIRSATSTRGPWHSVAIVSCMLGTACKETIVVAPVLVVLYDRAYLFDSWRAAWRERDRLYIGLAASWFVLAGFQMSGPRAAVGGLSAGVSVWTYLLNQAVVIVEYLRLSIWPSPLVAFYGWPVDLMLRDVLWQGGVVVGLLLATAVAFVRAPKLGFLGAWFFIALAPTSSVLPIVTEVAADRRMYVPLMAVVVLVVVAVDAVLARVWGRRDATGMARAGMGVGLLLVASTALAGGTIARNREYASGLTLARTIVERRPTAVSHHILGEQLALAGQTAEAEAELRKAVALGNSRARYQLGALLFTQRRFAPAVEQFEAYVKTADVPQRLRWLQPPVDEVLFARLMMAQSYAVQSQWPAAAEQARLLLAAVPRHPEAMRILAASFFGQRQWAESVTAHRDYLAARPGDVQAIINLGISLVATEQLDPAIEQFERAASLDPGNATARRLLALARQDQAAARGR